eukprot:TRINITY_DN1606_c0_g1_i1.p2 TRINITY_DN1606_c0_g1~~TRINITY_DN1606_c0_g1_i1.p2  ORF type:complete len:160 (+),score=51.54 TRINITY_DN1606_c0_g1_i1:27-506(+)
MASLPISIEHEDFSLLAQLVIQQKNLILAIVEEWEAQERDTFTMFQQHHRQTEDVKNQIVQEMTTMRGLVNQIVEHFVEDYESRLNHLEKENTRLMSEHRTLKQSSLNKEKEWQVIHSNLLVQIQKSESLRRQREAEIESLSIENEKMLVLRKENMKLI